MLEDEGAVIADSNAILVYLAKRYQGQARWLPEDALGAAAVQRWLSVAAGQLALGTERGAAGHAVRRARSRRRGAGAPMRCWP